MTMEGKRFGVGLVAGLLVGLFVVVASSGFSFGLFGTFSSTASLPTAGLTPYMTTTTTAASTSTTVASASSGTTQPPTYNLNSTLANLSTVNSSATTGTTPSIVPFTPAAVPSFSSSVESIPKQPIFTNAVIFLPVVAALILGAIFYVATMRGRSEVSREE